MRSRQNPKHGEKHHWFPKALAKAWVGADGLVGRTNSRGHSKRFHPSGIGYVPDQHNVFFDGGSPWDSTYEPQFDIADNAFPRILRWLETVPKQHPPDQRVSGVDLPKGERALLSECLASLIVRSPRLRYLAEKWTAEVQVRDFGFEEPKNVRNTASGNLARCQEPFSRDIRTGGKFAFLLAGEEDFVFGDGIMTNVHPYPDRVLRPMAMVAFTPKIGVLWFSPKAYPPLPVGVSIQLSLDEVRSFNDVVQVYSKDNLFHLGNSPPLHESFPPCQHYIVTSGGADHRTPLVDGWMAETVNHEESD